MQIDLSAIPAERSRLFLEHLRARLPNLRRLSIGIDSSSGIIEEISTSRRKSGGVEVSHVHLRIRWTQDGKLISLEAESESGGSAWRGAMAASVRHAAFDALE